MLANTTVNNSNLEFAKSFDSVKNEYVIIPQKDSDGNWTITSDRELKVLHLTDIHIGGGWLSGKTDALTINAVASMVPQKNLTLL